MLKTPRDDTFLLLILRVSHHCIGFSRTSLAISKYGSIVANKYIFYQSSTCFLENFGLLRFFGKDLIKTKYFPIFLLSALVIKCNLFFIEVITNKVNRLYIIRFKVLLDFYLSK